MKSLLEIPKREEGERDKKSWTDEDGFDGSKKTLRRNGHRGATMTTTVPKLDLAGVARADGEVEDPPVPAKVTERDRAEAEQRLREAGFFKVEKRGAEEGPAPAMRTREMSERLQAELHARMMAD